MKLTTKRADDLHVGDMLLRDVGGCLGFAVVSSRPVRLGVYSEVEVKAAGQRYLILRAEETIAVVE